MKKLTFLLLAACFAVSCAGDDDDKPDKDKSLNALIVGQWENISDTITAKRNFLFTDDFKVSFFMKNRETGYTASVFYKEVSYRLRDGEVYTYSDEVPSITYYVASKDILYINGKEESRMYKRIE